MLKYREKELKIEQVVYNCLFLSTVRRYNPFLVYCRELASGTVSLTGDRAQGDDSKYDSHYKEVSRLYLSIFV